MRTRLRARLENPESCEACDLMALIDPITANDYARLGAAAEAHRPQRRSHRTSQEHSWIRAST